MSGLFALSSIHGPANTPTLNHEKRMGQKKGFILYTRASITELQQPNNGSNGRATNQTTAATAEQECCNESTQATVMQRSRHRSNVRATAMQRSRHRISRSAQQRPINRHSTVFFLSQFPGLFTTGSCMKPCPTYIESKAALTGRHNIHTIILSLIHI